MVMFMMMMTYVESLEVEGTHESWEPTLTLARHEALGIFWWVYGEQWDGMGVST